MQPVPLAWHSLEVTFPGARLIRALAGFTGSLRGSVRALRPFISLIISVLVLYAASGQSRPSASDNGSIVEKEIYGFPPFEEQPASVKQFYSKDEYEKAKNSSELECLRIKYISDGLKIVGFVVKPKNTDGKKYPVIIFNRGGFLETGKIDLRNILDFYRLASEGFVILASQYRGNDGGEGKEELGGSDLADVLSLLPLARSLVYADINNVFLYGLSRGGMMAFLALRNGMAVNAVAVVGAVIDLEASIKVNPHVIRVARELIPDYESRGVEILRDRSVIHWAEKINAPLLIIHGSNDQEIPASQALALAIRLQELKKPYELIIYADDNHETMKNREDRNRRIVWWFKRYMK